MKVALGSALTVSATIAALGIAAPAHADENMYFQDIRQPNQLFISVTDSQLLTLGYTACNAMTASIKNGMSMGSARAQADTAVAQAAYSMGLESDRASNMNITEAAENNLC